MIDGAVQMMEHPDVIVVGAGLTGLTLACELARHGVSCRVIERAAQPVVRPQAVELMPRSQEVLAGLGLLPRIASDARTVRSINLYAAGQPRRLARIEYQTLQSPFPRVLVVSHAHLVDTLRARARALGVRVDDGVEFLSLEACDDGVRAQARDATGASTLLRARWLVGCDGADSSVRAALALPFHAGAAAARYWYVDVAIDWEMPEDDQYVFLAEHGFLLVAALPEPGRAMLMLDRPPDDRGEPSLERFQRAFARLVHIPARLEAPRWMTSERVHPRTVSRFRRGDVFLAGDAAHVLTPLAGHGLNTALQDAHNLAWKLGLVKRGLARPGLLDSYDEERRCTGLRAREEHDWTGRALRLRGSIARGVRDTLTPLLASVASINRRVARALSDIVVSYRGASTVEEHHTPLLGARLTRSDESEQASLGDRREFGAAPGAGDLAPSRTAPGAPAEPEMVQGTHHTLLLFDGQAPTAAGYRTLSEIAKAVRDQYGDLVRVHVVVPSATTPPQLTWDGSVRLDPDGELHRRYGARAECQYLIRPDGHIAFRSQPADRELLLAYLRRVFV